MDGLVAFLHSFWSDMVGRTDGPMTFRFFLQPTMALITALFDGIKDAKTGRTPYLWKMIQDTPGERLITWREGVTATARILILGVVMDVIYQIKVYGAFKHPLETFFLAVLLGFVPYLLLRGPMARIASRFIDKPSKS